MNQSLDDDSHISPIRAIPLLAGVKTENIIVKMSELPKIPDRAMTFEEMGEFMDSYQTEAKERSPKAGSKSKIEKKWMQMKKDADDDIEKIDDQYEMLLKEVQEMSKKH